MLQISFIVLLKYLSQFITATVYNQYNLLIHAWTPQQLFRNGDARIPTPLKKLANKLN